MYVTTFPCTKCAHAIVQAGIKEVYTYGTHWPDDPAGWEKAEEIFEEAGIDVRKPTIRKLHYLNKAEGPAGEAATAASPPIGQTREGDG